MKKNFLTTIAILSFTILNAQQQTKKGNWIIEANTGSIATGNTSIQFGSFKDYNYFSLGLDGGHFIIDNLALKAGFSYTSYSSKSSENLNYFNYKIGAQYYIISKIPVEIDFTGQNSKDSNINWIGTEAGYAIFLGKNVALTPKLRYNSILDKNKGDNSFQGLLGFTLFF